MFLLFCFGFFHIIYITAYSMVLYMCFRSFFFALVVFIVICQKILYLTIRVVCLLWSPFSWEKERVMRVTVFSTVKQNRVAM